MLNKFLKGAAIVVGSMSAGLLPLLATATTFSTTSLGAAIDDVSGNTYDYIAVLLNKFWPLLLGATILIGVLVFGKRVVHALFGK